MSIIPDLILQQAIVGGIRAYREDERLLRMLFRTLTLEEVDMIQKYFRDNSVDVSLNYPDQDLKLPAVVILMKSESLREAFLRDFQQGPSDFLDNPPLPKDELRGDQTIVGSGSRTTLHEPAKELLAPTTALGGSANTIIAPEGSIKRIDPFEEEKIYVVTMEGTAAGQRRLVTSIEPTLTGYGVVIEVSEAWIVNPDDTTIFTIVAAPSDPEDTLVGEWPKLYDQSDYTERFGAIYGVTYQLSIYAPDQELVIILYTILKSILFSARSFLVKNGLIIQSISGTDFAPQPEYYPDLGYSRSMSIEFLYHFDVFIALSEKIAERMQLQIMVKDPDIRDPDGVERVVSDTEIDLS